MDEHRPLAVLHQHKVTPNLPRDLTVFTEPFDIKTFKKKLKIVIVRNEDMEMELDLIGIHPAIANAFRRLMLSEVPSMAIDKVFVNNNTSIVQDEVLAHRIGLVPLKADPRQFDFKSAAHVEGAENESLEFELKIKCSYNKEANKKNTSRADDMYKNNNVYSKHIKWLPLGNQKEKFQESDVGPIDSDILIAKLRPGHEIDLKLVAVKGVGKDHAKFSPVATAFYRMLPEIKILKEVEGEDAYRLQKCFSPGVISVRQEKNGKKIAVVTNARYDSGSRNVFRYDDLKDSVELSRVRDHFVFSIESVGAMMPEVIFKEAVKTLREKCASLLEELISR